MDVYKISLNVTTRKELKSLLNFLVKNHILIDPCSPYPRIDQVEKNLAEVVPVTNPDGKHFSFQDGNDEQGDPKNMWRKNRRINIFAFL
jgi:hypothetical protein